MNGLVVIEKEELLTNSLILAEGVGYEHRTVLKLIREHECDIKDFGIISLGVRKSRRGKPTEFYNLTESQVYFIMTLMQNSDAVTKFKKELIKEFMRMRKALINVKVMHQNEEWQRARLEGKAIRRETTDVLKDFVEYAISQGSKNALRYYSNITNMENKSLFIIEQKFDNIREVLNNHQLATLRVADIAVQNALQEGMERSMHYKDIYLLAKERVEKISEAIKPTIVISATEVKLLK